ncbi:MAG: ABC transporter ATP-binding protein, partial [Burkholderiales bacterium]
QGADAPLLEVEGVRMAYGAVVALDDVSLTVRRGSITGLIGPHGSGTSTLFDCISGVQRHLAGSVRFRPAQAAATELSARAPARIARLGLRRTFQQLRVFPELTARENLLAAAQSAPGFSVFAEVLRLPAVRRHEREMHRRADELLERLSLGPKAGELAGELSYGQKKLVELGMAMMGHPELLLLDEPVAGVNPTLIEGLKAHLLAFRDGGVSLFVVEHNLKLVFEICDWIYVLDQGRLLTQGTPSQVAEDPSVVAAYLGAGGVRDSAAGGARD